MDDVSNVCESDSASSSSATSTTDNLFEELMDTVYTLTSDIQNEFEKLIDQHGNNDLDDLRPNVTRALELLNEMCTNQKDNHQMVKKLKYKASLLEHNNAINCIGYENLIAYMEKEWKKKLDEQLQENEKLTSALSSQKKIKYT